MRRLFTLAMLATIVAGTSAPAHADWLSDCWHKFWITAERNKRWPEPFVGPDRVAARAPFYTMVANGWRQQTTLAGHHFSSETHQLNEAGRMKLYWILYEAPPQHRNVFVYGDNDPAITQARIQAVELATAEMGDGSMLASIQPTPYPPTGAPADYVDSVDRKFRESTPAPRLPERTSIDLN